MAAEPSDEMRARVLSGVETDASIVASVHRRGGLALADSFRSEMPGLERVVVQTFVDEDAPVSRTALSSDRSGVLQISRGLQLAAVSVAHVYLHASMVLTYARRSQPPTRRRSREDEGVARLCAMLRHLVLQALDTGEMPVITRLVPALEDTARHVGQWAVAFTIVRELERFGGVHDTDADAAATLRLRRRFADTGADELNAASAALVAIGAIHLLERAVCIRPAPQHDAADVRWSAVHATFGSDPDVAAARDAGWFVTAIQRAADLGGELDPSFLRLLAKGEMLALPRGRDAVRRIEAANALHCGPLDALLATARRAATPAGKAVLATLADGRAEEGLALVADPEAVRRLLDPARSLAFPTLRAVFAARAADLTGGDAGAFAAVAARLAEPSLRA